MTLHPFPGNPQTTLTEADLFRPAPKPEPVPRWVPLLFLLGGIIFGMFLAGLTSWAARTWVEVNPPPYDYQPQNDHGRTPAP